MRFLSIALLALTFLNSFSYGKALVAPVDPQIACQEEEESSYAPVSGIPDCREYLNRKSDRQAFPSGEDCVASDVGKQCYGWDIWKPYLCGWWNWLCTCTEVKDKEGNILRRTWSCGKV